MDNPFADLIPQQQAMPQPAPQAAGGGNPFADLIPQQAPQNVSRGTPAPQADMSPFMSAIVGFNTGVGNLAHGLLQPVLESGGPLADLPFLGSGDKTGVLGEKVAKASKQVAKQRQADYQNASDANPFAAGAGEFAGSVAPTLFIPGLGTGSAAARLGKAALSGAGIGAAQYTNPDASTGMNAAYGAAGGLLGGAAGQLTELGFRKAAQKYAQSAMPGLVQKATDKIKGYIRPEQASQTLQANYNKAAGINTANWAKTDTLAQTLDDDLSASGQAFNASPFMEHIQQFSEKLKGMEPAVRAKYMQAADFANHIQAQAPQSFAGAVALRQNLNQELSRFLDKNNLKVADQETKNLIKGLKNSLQDTVDANKVNLNKSNRLFDDFKTAWEKANQSHQGLQEFYKAPTAVGGLKPFRQRREALQAGNFDSAGLGAYLRPSSSGLAGVDQLNRLTGSDDAARSYIMRNAIEGRGSPNTALQAYEKLSVPQRERLFSSLPEGQALKAASMTRNAFGEPTPRTLPVFMHHVGSIGLGAAPGFLGALALGGDWRDAALAGASTAALGKGGGKLVAKYATPSSVMKAVNRAQTPNPKAGRYLSPILASLFASREDS